MLPSELSRKHYDLATGLLKSSIKLASCQQRLPDEVLNQWPLLIIATCGCGSISADRDRQRLIREKRSDQRFNSRLRRKRQVAIFRFLRRQWFETVQRAPNCLRRNGTIVLATASGSSIKGQCPLSGRINTSARGKTARCRSAKSTEI